MGRSLRMLALLGLGLLVACAAPMKPEQISAVKPGETTYDQIVASFGLPTSEMNLSGGSKVMLYHNAEFDRSTEQLGPFYNLYNDDYDNMPYDFFIVGRDGVLQSYSIPGFARQAGVANPGS